MKKGFLKCGLGTLCLSVLMSRLFAVEHFVTVGNSFSPSSLTIDLGDTVTWISQDQNFTRTVTSDDNVWVKGYLYEEGETFSVVFNFATGFFPYHDDLGPTGSITVVGVVANPIIISSPKRLGTQFQFDISGLVVGRTNIIEASTNLTTWLPLVTNVATSTVSSYTNTQVSLFGSRFFRVVQLP